MGRVSLYVRDVDGEEAAGSTFASAAGSNCEVVQSIEFGKACIRVLFYDVLY